MNPIRLGVAGCGYWAPNVVRNLLSLKDVKLTGVCDVRPERARELAQRLAPTVPIFSDHRELLAQELDAVCVVTPISTHFQVAMDALRSGKHVFVEKPLAKTVEECEVLIREAESRSLILMVGHVFEFNAAVVRIKQYLDSAHLGNLLYIYSQRVNLGRIQNDISALWSFAPHDISIINYWLGGEPLAVSARGLHCLGQKVEDVVFVLLEYPDGIGVHLHLGWLDPRKLRQTTLVGTKKMLVYDDVSLDSRIMIYDKGVKDLHEYMQAPSSYAEFQYQTRSGDVVIPQLKFGEPLQEECGHFIECIRTHAKPRTDGQSGLRVVRVLEAAQKSIENGGARVTLAAQAIPARV